jgi:hypothetical protein
MAMLGFSLILLVIITCCWWTCGCIQALSAHTPHRLSKLELTFVRILAETEGFITLFMCYVFSASCTLHDSVSPSSLQVSPTLLSPLRMCTYLVVPNM